MKETNQAVVDKFFDAYKKRDFNGIKHVMADNVLWTFRGRHKFAGVKTGIDEVITFFDTMGKIMGESNPTVDKLIIASDKNYFIECQHIKTNRKDGNNVDHHVCVLWTIEDGKIISGRHFFADPEQLDHYFDTIE